MQHIIGTSRDQITFFPEVIEDYVGQDNPVRFIDAFVDRLDMVACGFLHAQPAETGRPPYHPKDLLKLYLYGYLHRLRSSRTLECETKRNIEVMWLLRRLSPDHKTISTFRTQHAEALTKVFRSFVLLCQQLHLFGADLVAIDSTKFKASNGQGQVQKRTDVEQDHRGLDQSIRTYFKQLDETDDTEQYTAESSITKEQLQEKIASLAHTQNLLDHVAYDSPRHICLTDPDARLMKTSRGIEPAYSVHTAVDAHHHLIVDYAPSQDAFDSNHLASVAQKASDTLGVEHLSVCADAGYYDTVDLKQCEDNHITTHVPIPASPTRNVSHYGVDRFVYEPSRDIYTCPQSQQLYRRSARVHRRDGRRIYIYGTNACRSCLAQGQCTTSSRGRRIARWEHEDVLERLKQRLREQPHIFRQRKSIVEHVFGTIKKIWGYDHFLLRGFRNINAEISLMFLAYNIKRALNLVGTQALCSFISTAP